MRFIWVILLINYILATEEPVDLVSCKIISETIAGNFIISSEDTLDIEGIDTLLTKLDKEYMVEQLGQTSKFRINKDSLKSKFILPWDTLQSLRKKGKMLVTFGNTTS